jgi:hypothetical protein
MPRFAPVTIATLPAVGLPAHFVVDMARLCAAPGLIPSEGAPNLAPNALRTDTGAGN